ncbi:MAG: aminotransferase class V-fold PLP-dependent enzyme [Vicinamibacteria bacterium]|nr:aminotransferase class V-fold PLP-dependent enzyme [Vicinamibacteria bacterium]
MRERPTPLDIDAQRFRELGHALVDRVAELLATLPARPVTRGERPSEVRHALGADAPLPAAGSEPGALLDEAHRLLAEHSLFNGHPRFFGYITAGPAPIGVLADLLASAANPNVGAWTLSPMATEIEVQTVRWIAELIGFPGTCGGVLVSGGNMANFVAFLAARQAQAGWDVRAKGLRAAGARPLTAYVSAETHTWIQKAADLFGLGTDAVRWVATDDELRMDVGALRDHIARDRAAGLQPFLVVGTAGSVSTGAVDPLPAIALLCREQGLWFHVDGAYGGFAAAARDVPADLRGLALADSVAVDPHKWLYAPLEAGCTLVRDPQRLSAAFSYHPPYYFFGEEAQNFVDAGMQNSRGFRALKVWLQLRHAGRDGYARMIDEDIALARELHGHVAAAADLEAATLGLSISTFRYRPADLAGRTDEAEVATYLDELNRELLARIQGGGEAFVSNAVVGGRFLLRACIVNFRTTSADVAALPGIVSRLGRELDRALRPASLRS